MRNNKLSLYQNGMIFKKVRSLHEDYLGVEGDNWFIDSDTKGIDQNELEYICNYYINYIDMSWQDDNFVDCASDIDYISRYASICNKIGDKYMILFCETEVKYPIWNKANNVIDKNRLEFLGYDYAYPGGSFYSCINNDVVSKRIQEFNCVKLNQNGLIQTEGEMIKFIELREKLKKTSARGTFEGGKFIVYKLWRYVGENYVI